MQLPRVAAQGYGCFRHHAPCWFLFTKWVCTMDITQQVTALQASVTALEMAVKVLYAYAPPEAKDELKELGDGYLDQVIALPMTESQLQLLAQSLRAIHRK